MTDTELRHLRKTELLELLLEVTAENEALRQKIHDAGASDFGASVLEQAEIQSERMLNRAQAQAEALLTQARSQAEDLLVRAQAQAEALLARSGGTTL